MTKTIYAVIPARQGSKGVANKNIKLLGGHPLIAYSIALAKMTKEVSRVIVSTDSEEYAQIARMYGAEVPFLRPVEIANDKSTDLEFFQHCVYWFNEKEKSLPDYFLHLRPTTPLRDPHAVSKGITDFLKSVDSLTSMRSGHLCTESPYKWFKKNPQGFFTNLSDDQNLDSSNRARQEFPEVFVPDGYVDIVKTSLIVEQSKIHGDRVMAFVSPFCVEIDTADDFDYLEFCLNKHSSVLKKYLDDLKK